MKFNIELHKYCQNVVHRSNKFVRNNVKYKSDQDLQRLFGIFFCAENVQRNKKK